MARYPSSFIWIVKYIARHYRTKTRYELDQKLLSTGYAAEEIEQAWQALQTGKYKLLLDENPKPARKRRNSWGFRLGCLLPLVCIILLVILATVPNLPAFIDPLPVYPGSSSISSKKRLPADLSFHLCEDGMAGFNIEDFQAYATNDSANNIFDFYEHQANGRGFTNGCQIFYGSYGTQPDELVFSKGLPGLYFNSKKTALAVVILNRTNVNQNDLIKTCFPDTPATSNLILVMRGTLERTLG